jgi:hypothetical protein
MARILIPQDRDVLVELAAEILQKNPALSKTHGVKLPPRTLKELRGRVNRARRALERARILRRKADAFARAADPDVEAIRRAVRDVAQMLQLQTKDPESVKQWGFRFGEARGAKAPAVVS